MADVDPAPGPSAWLRALGALGVVYGDIGTSPLYALQTVFTVDHHAVHPTPAAVYGVISLVFWAITVIVSVKMVLRGGARRRSRSSRWASSARRCSTATA